MLLTVSKIRRAASSRSSYRAGSQGQRGGASIKAVPHEYINVQMGFHLSAVWKRGKAPVFVRGILFRRHTQDSRKVSHAGRCRLIVSVSRGEIIGSSNLPVCTLISCVILGLLLPEAANLREGGHGFGRDCIRVYFLSSQIDHCSWSLFPVSGLGRGAARFLHHITLIGYTRTCLRGSRIRLVVSHTVAH